MVFIMLLVAVAANAKKELWPDGTVIDPWFSNATKIDPTQLGRH